MKKMIAICLAVLLTLVLCSCGESDKTPHNARQQNNAASSSGGPVSPDPQESPGQQAGSLAPTNPGQGSASFGDGRGDLIEPEFGDPGPGDPGDTNDLEWWGIYKSDDLGFSIEITEYSGSDFWVDICLLRNGGTVLAGKATITPEDDHLAVFGDIGFYLYDDFSAIDIVGNEDSQWAHMRGQYAKID